MPRFDGTGPLGKGPMTGRGRGTGVRQGRGRANGGKSLGGSSECTCPKCGYKEPHNRGIPCTERTCPKCETPMKGAFC